MWCRTRHLTRQVAPTPISGTVRGVSSLRVRESRRVGRPYTSVLGSGVVRVVWSKVPWISSVSEEWGQRRRHPTPLTTNLLVYLFHGSALETSKGQ